MLRLQDRRHRGVRAYPVVMAIRADHAAVEAHVAGGEGGHGLQLRGEEVAFHDAVFFIENLQNIQLDQLAALIVPEGPGADEDVQILSLDPFHHGALHLLGSQMGQQIGDAENRIARVLPTHTVTAVPSRRTMTP